MITLADLIEGAVGVELPTALRLTASSIPIAQVEIDSRRVVRGSAFFALKGEQTDGHLYIDEAIARGAVAVVAERPPESVACRVLRVDSLEGTEMSTTAPTCIVVPNSLLALQRAAAHWRRAHTVRVIGVTGSVGKTMTKEMSAAVLGQRYQVLKSEGNYNSETGLPLTLLRLQAGHERAVLEMGMYALGEIAALTDIALPAVGVVTNVGPSHLQRLGTIERIAQAKAELVRALPPADDGGVAILNADDERVRNMASFTRARVFTFGLTPEADLWADEIEGRGLEGVRFRLRYGDMLVYAQIPLLGRHSVHTALSAAAVGVVEGLSLAEIAAGLCKQQAQLRLVAVPGPQGSILLDDTYNASPASSIAALNLLAELEGRRLTVHGDMCELGDQTEEGHRLVGRRIRDVADLLVTVGSLAGLIAAEALEAGMPASAVYQVRTNAEAIDLLKGLIRRGDVVLVKGSRAMKMEEIVAALSCVGHTADHGRKEA